jgi:polynucleotide 5'-hydroxyl-kinase GRC3/NOL9
VEIDVHPNWEKLTFASLTGVILVVGAPDTGKTTFARYLYRRLCKHHERVAFIDGDMGQATLGPPTTMTLAFGQLDDAFPPTGPRHRFFVGDVTPRGHMLPTLVGAHRLVQKAREEGASAIVFDTTGLVGPAQGGDALKQAKVDLLQPTVVVGIQRRDELEYLLLPLRLSRRTRAIDLPVSQAARRPVPALFRRRTPFGGSMAAPGRLSTTGLYPKPLGRAGGWRGIRAGAGHRHRQRLGHGRAAHPACDTG